MKISTQRVFSRKLISLLSALFLFVGAFAVSTTLNSCKTLSELAGLSKLQFKLDNATNIQLAGINIAGKRSISDISFLDAAKLVSAFGSGKFPLTFTLNVAAKNPNQATQNSALSSVSLVEFPWRLLLDGQETISGGIGGPVTVPSGGNTSVIPLQVSVDLIQFFGNQGYDKIVNLALAVAGEGVAKMQLKAQPTIQTNVGRMTYPNELTIVSTEFR